MHTMAPLDQVRLKYSFEPSEASGHSVTSTCKRDPNAANSIVCINYWSLIIYHPRGYLLNDLPFCQYALI